MIDFFAITVRAYLTNTAHIQGQIFKYIQGSNCELTARVAREMSTALMSCESNAFKESETIL